MWFTLNLVTITKTKKKIYKVKWQIFFLRDSKLVIDLSKTKERQLSNKTTLSKTKAENQC